ncbi:endo alpha-1,4 polygalactosaminidase [Clavibacter michiganensis]|uniref:endo alpha-1,4 polygalactosaminidase n=1 Tax=Clavibacter michiganensis TaxID=28447 RepID=UPI0005BDE172|nr:endo alpha-1,4 polygalactosaminidase [Clavibacter michiganensis]
MRSLLAAALVVATLAVAGCSSPADPHDARAAADPAVAAVAETTGSRAVAAPTVTLPPTGTRFDYQLGGASKVPAGVGIVVRDSTDAPAPGVYGVCYVNGFQTQPGAAWPDALLVRGADGKPIVDPGWPDERILDVSTPAARTANAARIAPVIDGCAAAGYRAVEFDNLDSWTRSAGALDEDDALAFATLLVARAHDRGLAAAQKNATDLGSRGRDEARFDFAIAEECDRWKECAAYTDVYGARVLDVEYTDDLRDSATGACKRIRAMDPAPAAIVRDRDLVPAGTRGYAYRAC